MKFQTIGKPEATGQWMYKWCTCLTSYYQGVDKILNQIDFCVSLFDVVSHEQNLSV